MPPSDRQTESGPHLVEVWHARLDRVADVGREIGLLSGPELDRAGRFRVERDRRRFVLAHGFLRRVLARHLRMDPALIRFGSGPAGKPCVLAPESPLHFNLSHADDHALVAVAQGRPVGLDIERIADIEHDVIATHFFSRLEMEQLQSLDGGDKARAFAACWTRKEAYVKATGAGVTAGLDHFDVSLLPGAPAALLADRRDPSAARWRLVSLEAPEGYEAALAAEGHDWQPRRLTLEPPTR